ncbi:MAG TPA: carbohydrate-binding domain-containing protein, partial [Cellvibrio sp.]|nr:carbohydrate-binding domain-containing protein [Cellvibrio sp.]
MKSRIISRRIGQYAVVTAAGTLLACAVQAQTLGANLAITGPSAGADGSGFDNTKLVRDGSAATATQATGTSNQRVSVKWGSAVTFNTVILRELGSKVTTWSLIDNDSGAVLATGTGIGTERVLNLGTRSAKKINLIVNASSAPAIAEIEVYNATGALTSSAAASSKAPASSVPASSAATSVVAVSSSSVTTTTGQQCNWYGQGLWPICATNTSGWGWENNASCIAAVTCAAQPAPYGIVGGSSSVAPSSVPASSKSSVAPSSTPVSSAAPSSVPKSSVAPSSAPKSSVAPSSTPASSKSSSSVASSDGVIRPAKMEGFAAHAGVTGG